MANDLLDFLEGGGNALMQGVRGVLPAVLSGGNKMRNRLKDAVFKPRKFAAERAQDMQTMKDQDSAYVYQLLNQKDPARAAKSMPGLAKSDPAWVQQQADASQQRWLDVAMNGLTVWHGSPHKFDKFDMSKIGTGEGAQAYGHGLYFAENPATARTYSADRAYVGAAMDGKPTGINYDDPRWIAQKTIDEFGDAAKAKAHLEMVARTAAKHQTAETAAAVKSAIDLVSTGAVAPKGNLYKVDLPDSAIEKMLDWDAPLSQQPEAVRAAAQSLGVGDPYMAGMPARMVEADGFTIYNNLSKKTRGPKAAADAEAARQLRALGIPGIRYLDGGSRGAGTGTRNFVVFDDQLPKIQEVNGNKLLR